MLTLHADTPEQYHAALLAHPLLLVDFYKDNCPGCRMLEMSLASVAASLQAGGAVLLKVRLEAVGEAFFREWGLRQTPTLSVVRDGCEVERLAGFQSPVRISQALVKAQSGA